MKNTGTDEGFTLVELLVVVTILGILAVVVVVGVRGATQQAQSSACGIEQRALRTGVQLLKADVGEAAAISVLDTDGLDALITAGFAETPIVNHVWDDVGDDVVGAVACA